MEVSVISGLLNSRSLLRWICRRVMAVGHDGPNLTSVCHIASTNYTKYTKVSGFGYFSLNVADRCIKSSTQTCNLHSQTLAVEWPY